MAVPEIVAASVRVKICGVNDELALDTAVDAGADWIGFVFYPPSPRYVVPVRASVLSQRARQRKNEGGPLHVGLFVDPTSEAVGEVLASLRLDVLQVYGTVDLRGLRERFRIPVWRAVGLTGAADLPVSAGGADALVLEAKAPPQAGRPGGNALSFDWAIMDGWSPPAPWILAGGLTPANVAHAIRSTGARAVDVSSGVEVSPGVKDQALIRSFITAARAALA